MADLGILNFKMGLDNREFLEKLKKSKEVSAETVQEIEKMLQVQSTKSKTVENTSSNLAYQSRMLGQLKNAALSYLSVWGAVGVTKNLIRISGEFELQERSLSAIVQSAEQAHDIFSRIKKLAVESPFMVKDLMTYAKQLSAFSEPTKDLFDTTKMLADVSAGLGVDMSRIILAYGQVRAAAVLRGQELRQFTEAGIPLVKELADRFSELRGEVVTTGQVFELISKRQVPFQMIRDIFVDMTSEGGKFYNMQEIQAETLKGRVSNLVDAYQIMLSEIGSAHEKTLKGGVDLIRELLLNWEDVVGAIKIVVAAFGAYKAAQLLAYMASKSIIALKYAEYFISVVSGVNKATAATTAFGNASKAASVANPWFLLLSAVAAVGTAIYQAHQRATALGREMEEISYESHTNAQKNISNLDNLIERIRKTDRGTESYREAVAALNRGYGEFLPTQIKVADSFDTIASAADKAREAIMGQAASSSYKKQIEAIDEDYEKIVNNLAKKAINSGMWIDIRGKFGIFGDVETTKMQIRAYMDKAKQMVEKDPSIAEDMNKFRSTIYNMLLGGGAKGGVSMLSPVAKNISEYAVSELKRQAKINEAKDITMSIFGITPDLYESLEKEEKRYVKSLETLETLRMSEDAYEKTRMKIEKEHNENMLYLYKQHGLAQSENAKAIQANLDAMKESGVAWRDTAEKMTQTEKSFQRFAPTNEEYDMLEYIDRLNDEYESLSEQIKRYKSIDKKQFDQSILEGLEKDLKFVDSLLNVFGVKERPGDEKHIKDREKEVKEAIKKSIDNINEEIKAYSQRYDFYKYLLESGKSKETAISMSFGVKFEGEPNLQEFIKKQMNELVKGRGVLNLDVDFSVAEFDDILKGMSKDNLLDEATIKALRDLFNDVREMSISEKKAIDEMFDKYLGYTAKKIKLDNEYAAKREELMKHGADSEILNNLLEEYRESADKLALEFSEKDIEFNTFVNSLAQKSIEELSELLMKIDLEMSKMIDADTDNENAETIAKLRARIVELEKQLLSVSGKGKKVKEVSSYSEWKRLSTVLNKVQNEFDEMGESIGGVAGEAIKAAGIITSSTIKMIDGITSLADWSVKATEKAAEGATKAISAAEKASVVLAIISAAMQLMQAVMDFDTDRSEYQRELEKDRNALAREYNKLLIERIAIEDQLFGGNKLQNVLNVISAYGEAAKQLEEIQKRSVTIKDFYAPGRYTKYTAVGKEGLQIKTKDRSWFQKMIGLVDEYEDLEKYLQKQGIKLFNENGELDLDVAKEVVQWKNITDYTKEYLEDLISVQEQMDGLTKSIEEYVDSVYGGLGDLLTDAIVNVFKNGKDAAEDFRDDVVDVLEDVAAQMTRMMFLQPFIDKYKETIVKFYTDFAKTQDKAKFTKDVLDATASFFDAVASTEKETSEFLKFYQEEAKKRGFDLFVPDSEKTESKLSRSISGITEDQADLLGSYANAIREYTARIVVMMEANKELMPTINSTLSNCQMRLVEISENTLRNANNTDDIRIMLESVIKGTKMIHVM